MLNPPKMDRIVLSGLHGRGLSAVVFVCDYLQLQFGGPLLTLTNWPIVVEAGKEWLMGDAGYRDHLCGYISRSVREATAVPDDHFELVFEDGSRLVVSMKPEDRQDPEIVRYNEDATKFWVF